MYVYVSVIATWVCSEHLLLIKWETINFSKFPINNPSQCVVPLVVISLSLNLLQPHAMGSQGVLEPDEG